MSRTNVLKKLTSKVSRFIYNNKFGLLALFSMGLAADIFMIPKTEGPLSLLLLFVWAIVVKCYDFASLVTFKLMFSLLLLVPLLLIVSLDSYAEKLAMWVALLFLFGAAQQVICLRKMANKKTANDGYRVGTGQNC